MSQLDELDPGSPESLNESTHIFVGLNALIIVVVISTALWLAHLIKKIHLNWLSDSGAAMLLGVLVGLLVNLFGWSESHHHLLLFDPELFFFALLPPIIFEAGYSMKKTAFFANVGTILLFAVVGTLTSTLVVGYGLFWLSKIGFLGLDTDNPIECLIFGSLLSSVDPVAVLSILGHSRLKSPIVYSLIFGESVLNDAVSIVLFRTFQNFHKAASPVVHHTMKGVPVATPGPLQHSMDEQFDHFTVGTLFLNFLLVSLGSLWIGILVGLICSFLFKNANLSTRPDVEFTLTIFFAYTSYCLSEILELSGIMSLFACSIVLSHYNWFNMSPASRLTTKYAFKSFALISETSLFSYLGMSAVVSVRSVLHLEWSVMLILATAGLCLLARAMHIFPLSFLSNLVSRAPAARRITVPIQIFLWFSSIRGAIAFALALNVFTTHRALIVSSTMAMVILSTVFLGGMTSPVLRRLGLVFTVGDDLDSDSRKAGGVELAERNRSSRREESIDIDGTITANGTIGDGDRDSDGLFSDSLSDSDEDDSELGCLARHWRQFDEQHIQEWFGGYAHARFPATRGGSSTRPVVRSMSGGSLSDALDDPDDATGQVGLESSRMRTHQGATFHSITSMTPPISDNASASGGSIGLGLGSSGKKRGGRVTLPIGMELLDPDIETATALTSTSSAHGIVAPALFFTNRASSEPNAIHTAL